jgi:hypothetical protein
MPRFVIGDVEGEWRSDRRGRNNDWRRHGEWWGING